MSELLINQLILWDGSDGHVRPGVGAAGECEALPAERVVRTRKATLLSIKHGQRLWQADQGSGSAVAVSMSSHLLHDGVIERRASLIDRARDQLRRAGLTRTQAPR
jgi:hypothetical protein